MNGNINLSNLTSFFKPLRPYGSYFVILALLGLFGYTGWVINESFNPQPLGNGIASSGKVIFDQSAIEKVKSLNQDNVGSDGSSLGASTSNAFGN